jgi:hypothetical protein
VVKEGTLRVQASNCTAGFELSLGGGDMRTKAVISLTTGLEDPGHAAAVAASVPDVDHDADNGGRKD